MKERGNYLSFSEINVLQMCSAKWKYQYFEQIPWASNTQIAFGTAIHQAITAWLKDRTRNPIETFLVALSKEQASIPLSSQEPLLFLSLVGESLIETYISTIGNELVTLQLEPKWQETINGVEIVGYPDIVAEHSTGIKIIDLKTVSRSLNQISESQRLQLTIYALLYFSTAKLSKHPLTVEIHQLNKKTQEVSLLQEVLTEDDYRFAESVIPLSAQSIMSGVYLPNRANPLCTKKHCSFWQNCLNDYGGKIKD